MTRDELIEQIQEAMFGEPLYEGADKPPNERPEPPASYPGVGKTIAGRALDVCLANLSVLFDMSRVDHETRELPDERELD